MKILAVGRNYAAHAQELANAVPDQPVIFMKPETALVENGKPFNYPAFSREVHYEGELVLRIGQEGKNIPEDEAHRYYDAVTVGVDFTARDLQQELKNRQVSWELAKAFDNSAAVGAFQPLDQRNADQPIRFSLFKNGQCVQNGNTKWLLFPFPYIISFLSRYFTLQTGDLIFTGTPAGVGPVQAGDQLNGYLEDKPVLTCPIC